MTETALQPATVAYEPWETFISHFRWGQGEHLAMIGPTGTGKTTLALNLLAIPTYVAVVATKPRDSTMTRLKEQGYRVLPRWQPWYEPFGIDPRRFPRRIIWPYIGKLAKQTLVNQRNVVHEVFQRVYSEGAWTLYLDELWYVTNMLRLDHDVKMLLQQARSLDVSLAVATQRPAFVPLEVYDQSTHLFFFRDNDERNLARLSGISWRSARLVKQTIANLAKHEFLYVHSSGYMVRSQTLRGES